MNAHCITLLPRGPHMQPSLYIKKGSRFIATPLIPIYKFGYLVANLARVQNVIRVEHALDARHEADGRIAYRNRPIFLLCVADTMLADT